ncbi:LptA/OstA family protein [Novosphingobium sp. NPDC080210]|uniref:LptA/OstA family protein n=1 Tax=unclassified Novosphingobium TaxID=2644732 RepID=UPI0035B29AFB
MSQPARPSLKTTALRSLLGGFALGTAAILALAPSSAQVFSGHNSDAPVNFSADHGELQGKANRAILAGNVVITQANMTLRAGRTTMAFTTEGGGFKIHRVDAVGGVKIDRGDQAASGDVAIYDFDKRLITLSGNVTLLQGSNRLSGGRLTIDLNSGLSTLDGRVGGGSPALGGQGPAPRGGRISGTFTVPKRSTN